MPLHLPPPGIPVAYTPVLKGATDDPSAATYSTQVGRYILIGKLCWVNIHLITTSITKTTLTDDLRISLPFTAANNSGQVHLLNGRTTNGTPVQNANIAIVAANTAYLTMGQLPLTAALANITYALLSLGVLTNTITFQASGVYEVA